MTNTEPVLTAAGLSALVVAGLNVLHKLDYVNWDAGQLATINIFAALLVGVGFAIWARGRVKPV